MAAHSGTSETHKILSKLSLLEAWHSLAQVIVTGAGELALDEPLPDRGSRGNEVVGVDDCAVVGVESLLLLSTKGDEGVEEPLLDSWGSCLLDWGRGEPDWGRGTGGSCLLDWGGCDSLTVAVGVALGLDVDVGLGGDLDVDVLLDVGVVAVLGVGDDAGLLQGDGGAAGGPVEGLGEGDLGLLHVSGVGDVLGSGSGDAEQSQGRHEALHDDCRER